MLSSLCGFWFQISIPVGTMQTKELAGTMRPDPWRGQVRKRPWMWYLAIMLLKRRKQKAFMLFYIYVVLSIGPGVRWSPRRRSPCLPFGRLSRDQRDARSIITRPGSEQPSGIFLSCSHRHQPQGKALGSAQHSPRPCLAASTAGEISGIRQSALMLQQETKVRSDNIWSVSRCEVKNRRKPKWKRESAVV